MARTSAALIVDSDMKGLESLVYGFQGVDWRSTACPALEAAAFLVKASAADVLVLAAREPYAKALTLLRQLRSSNETSTLPVLVLGPASLRPAVLECGAIDFLPTPVFVRDVIAASRILVSIGHSHDQGHEQKVEGTLADFGCLSLIRVMSGLRRSGVLQIERANRRGEIVFSEGEIAGAQVGSLQGPPAIHHLLLWEDAKVELRFRAVARRGQFNRRVDQIIDEAERFQRDYAHAVQSLGPTCRVFERNDAKLTGSTVPSEVAPVLRLCDGRRTLADTIDESPFRVFDTIRILTRLMEMGVLVGRKLQDGIAPPTPALQKFWETALIAGSDDSVAPASASRPVPARVGPIDPRTAEQHRRKGQRRTSAETPVQGTPIVGMDLQSPAAGPAETASVPTPAAPVADTRKARASGTFDIPAADDRRHDKPDRRSRPSVTIDVGQVEAVSPPSPKAAPVAIPAAPVVSPPRTGRVTGTMQVAPSAGHRRSTTVPRSASGGISVEIDPGLAFEDRAAALAADVPSAAKAGSGRTGATPGPIPSTASQKIAVPAVVAPAPAPPPASSAPPAARASIASAETRGDGVHSARVTGTLSITPSQRSAAPRNSAKGASVQLDPVLMAELGRLEKATTPVGPPESDQPLRTEPVPPAARAPAAAAPAAEMAASLPSKPISSARATGTLSIAHSSHSSTSSVPKSAPSGFSVALDPALMAEAQKLDAPNPPRPTAAPERTTPGEKRGETSSGPSAPSAPRPTPHTSQDSHRDGSQAARTTGRISGTFNDVERDFFAREADLYKREAEDNFADLDEPAGRGTTKRPPGRGPTKKHA